MRSEVFGYLISCCRREGFECDFKRVQIESVNALGRLGCIYGFCFLFPSVNVYTGLFYI